MRRFEYGFAHADVTARCATGSLGSLADSVRAAPTATMAATGAIVGGLWGAASGWIGSRLLKRNPAHWTLGGAVVGAVVVGTAAYRSGTALEQWLARYTP